MVHPKIKRIGKTTFRLLCFLSLAFNLLLFILVLTVDNDYIAIPKLKKGEAPEYAAVCVVTAPVSEDLSSFISFGTLDISARAGDTLGIQISAFLDRKQSFSRFRFLYDKRVLRVSGGGRKTLIRALSPGESLLEALGAAGEKIPVARIRVR